MKMQMKISRIIVSMALLTAVMGRSAELESNTVEAQATEAAAVVRESNDIPKTDLVPEEEHNNESVLQDTDEPTLVEPAVEEKASPKKPTANKKAKNKSRAKNINIDAQGNELPEDAQLLDKIVAIVFASEGTKVITKSQLDRPGLDGRTRTLDELIFEALLLLDALKFKMAPDDETIDKYLANIQRENNLTLDQLKKIFKSAGYTYEEGREQFGMMSIVNQILDFKIRSRLIVPEKDVVAYYKEHPELIEASYLIERGLIPFADDKTQEQQQNEIELFVNHGTGSIAIDWQPSYWMAHSEFADDKLFITELQPKKISAPQITSEGFEVYRVVESKPAHERPLEDRYRAIVDVLRAPRYEQLMEEYKKQLFDCASILKFD